jgi:hypothetical protein
VCQERIASGVSQPWPSRASRAAFDEQLGEATYAVTCRGVADTRNDLVVRQGTETFPAYPFIAGPIAVIPYVPGVYWDLTSTSRGGQWLAIGPRAADGTLLPILERRVSTVSSTTFTVDEAVGADYLGAPVVDNKMRVLGTVNYAGTGSTEIVSARAR